LAPSRSARTSAPWARWPTSSTSATGPACACGCWPSAWPCWASMAWSRWAGAGRHSVYAGPRLIWLSNLVGGLLFGLGMVLASGCGSKTLVRIGGGNLKALVVFCVLALASYATLRGVVAVARVATVDAVAITLPVGQDLPSLLAAATGLSRAGKRPAGRRRHRRCWSVLRWPGTKAAVRIPAGRPGHRCLGGGRLVGVGHLGHLAEHPLTLEESFLATNTQRMESLHLRGAHRLHGGLADPVQRQEQGADHGHRQHAGRGGGLGRWWRWPRAAFAGKVSPAPKTPPTTSSARC
jgi:hypothetical protein